MTSTVDYGTLAPLVKAAGWLASSAAAITFTWKRRVKLEPSEEDVPNGSRRIAGLLSAVSVGYIYAQLSTSDAIPALGRVLLVSSLTALAVFLVYLYLIGAKTYDVVYATGVNTSEKRRVIGGFRFLDSAKQVMAKRGINPQQCLEGRRYDPDKVWTKESRALAKVAFTLCYILLIVSGTCALSCAAILLLLKRA